MAPRKRPRRSGRVRIGSVSLYEHHGSWWVYFRENGKPVRRHVGDNLDEARAVGARVNAELAASRPTIFSFEAVAIDELVRRWLGYHEQVLRSSVATCNRYRTATEHLVRFVEGFGAAKYAHEIKAEQFVGYLRTALVAPNGHANATKRRLTDKGVKFILGACRSLFNYGGRSRLLPPYFENPFAALPIDRMPIEDAKAIHVFTAEEEFTFLAACDAWQFSIFYTLAKLGLRSGELTHLLVEDVDLVGGVLHIRNKPDLGWQVKTRNVRSIPLPTEPLSVLKAVVADRKAGVLFLRPRFLGEQESPLQGMAQPDMAGEITRRAAALAERLGHTLARAGHAQVARAAWRDAGAIKTDKIRVAFMQLTSKIGMPEVTAPKCWRHTFATTMQEASVDPLIRQLTMGHVPAGSGRSALGMTATYTHTPMEVHRRQLQAVIDLRPRTTELIQRFLAGNRSATGKEA